MTLSLPVAPERLQQARRLFFEHGEVPEGWVDAPILRSWQRCLAQGRRVHEPVAFNAVGRATEAQLIERNRRLVVAAEPELERLAQAVAGAGYAVLLTDAQALGLRVHGALQGRSAAMQLAFRPGIDLSEAAIGTSAMSAALVEREPVRVFGEEHYFASNRLFHCVAAPVVDPGGELLGVVDVTRDAPGDAGMVLALVRDCAQHVEQRLVRALPAAVWVHWGGHADGPRGAAVLAFGADGELLGATPLARRWLEISHRAGWSFESIFQAPFSQWVEAARRADHPLPLRSQGGVALLACADFNKRAAAVRSGPVAVVGTGSPSASAIVMPTFGDTALEFALQQAARAYRAGLPVLLRGETGTGKEIAARALHQAGRRHAGPLVPINCAAIPESLIEAELFGYVEGAFTGARKGGYPGKVRAAHGGTLFLDEIGDMPLALQARLLRVLETREVVPVGAVEPITVDIQLICATHHDLALQVAQGQFRADLWYRIRGAELTLPPLRERSGLADWLDTLLAAEAGDARVLVPAARARLLAYHWPGNVRELRHALRYAAAMAADGPIQAEHLPSFVGAGSPRASVAFSSADRPVAVPERARTELNTSRGTLKAWQQASLQEALAACQGNVSAAARRLGISRATLYRWLQRHPG